MNRATAKDRHSAEHPRPAAGQAPAPAQDRGRAGIVRRHIRGVPSNPARAYCTADNQDWPCDAIWLLSICTSYRDLSGRPVMTYRKPNRAVDRCTRAHRRPMPPVPRWRWEGLELAVPAVPPAREPVTERRRTTTV